MLCGWRVKSGRTRAWWQVKLCECDPLKTRVNLSVLEDPRLLYFPLLIFSSLPTSLVAACRCLQPSPWQRCNHQTVSRSSKKLIMLVRTKFWRSPVNNDRTTAVSVTTKKRREFRKLRFWWYIAAMSTWSSRRKVRSTTDEYEWKYDRSRTVCRKVIDDWRSN